MEEFTKLSERLTEAIMFSDTIKLEKAAEIAAEFNNTLGT